MTSLRERDAGFPRIELEVTGRGEQVEQALAEPLLNVEAQVAVELDGIRRAHHDEDGSAAFEADIFGHRAHATEQAGHQVELGLAGFAAWLMFALRPLWKSQPEIPMTMVMWRRQRNGLKKGGFSVEKAAIRKVSAAFIIC